MFKTKKTKIDPNMTDTLIGEGTRFEGRIKSEAGIRIEGSIVGDIETIGDVTIGENGEARSNISARNVILAGQVHGNVQANGKLTIMATGRLHGNLSSLELCIESGGVFLGTSSLLVKESAAAAEDKPAQENAAVPQPAAAANAPEGDSAATVLKSW